MFIQDWFRPDCRGVKERSRNFSRACRGICVALFVAHKANRAITQGERSAAIESATPIRGSGGCECIVLHQDCTAASRCAVPPVSAFVIVP